ncbi:MotA/TolQ/ExbB proton channel family protein, partial [Bordetella hinzii]|nr:MotA/TolQ/ExbB proton channel family protein [Bordetella hinzii]
MFNALQNAMMVVAQAAAPAAPAAGAATSATPPAAPAAIQQAATALNAAPAPAPDMGFLHFVAQSDFVGKTLFIILILMSLVTWYLIVVKAFSNLRMRKRAANFLNHFWNASSLQQVENEIITHGARDPFSHLASHAIHA